MSNNVRVCDLVIDYLYQQGVDKIFTITGGGSMFLNDGLASHSKMEVICNHHEQACAMAAVGYAKFRNDFGVAIVTTGCGATNAITGLLDAWQDNVPCIFISGQVKREHTSFNTEVPLRQFGVQEANIVDIVKSITKYSVMINEPTDILYELQKAAYLAKSGRPGPVWLDVPLDVQGATIDCQNIRHYEPVFEIAHKPVPTEKDIQSLRSILSSAKRPIIIAGNGIRLGNAQQEFKSFVEQTGIPFAVSHLGVDLLPSDHDQYVGRLGIKGDRAGNFAVQNSDLVISLGCRLSVALTGFEFDLFAREAQIVVVDIDKNEHQKNTIKIDCMIHSDLVEFFSAIGRPSTKKEWEDWNIICCKWRKQWPVCLPEYVNDKDGINKYYFIDRLGYHLKDDSIVVSDTGSAYYVTSQALKIKGRQRYITSGAQVDMGFTLPAAIGACVAKKGEVIGITGDGSFQMNIQELQTLVQHKIPVKLVIWNNNGYLSMRITQRKYFPGREIGTDKDTGVSFPNLKKIANAYGIKYFYADNNKELDSAISSLMKESGPGILEVMCPCNQEVVPTASSVKLDNGKMVSKPLEDLYPFLDRKNFLENMIVTPVD